MQGHYLAGRSSASPLFYNKMAAYSSGIIPWPHISLAEGLVMKLLTASHQITRIHECLIRCGVLFWFFYSIFATVCFLLMLFILKTPNCGFYLLPLVMTWWFHVFIWVETSQRTFISSASIDGKIQIHLSIFNRLVSAQDGFKGHNNSEHLRRHLRLKQRLFLCHVSSILLCLPHLKHRPRKHKTAQAPNNLTLRQKGGQRTLLELILRLQLQSAHMLTQIIPSAGGVIFLKVDLNIYF